MNFDNPLPPNVHNAHVTNRLKDPPETLEEAAYRYANFSTKMISDGTYRLYKITVVNYEKFLGRRAVLSDLNDETYSHFVKSRTGVVAHETLRGECNKLLALWRWCSTGKRCWVEGPDVCAPQPKYRLPKALDKEQLAALWEAAESYPYMIGTIPGNIFLPALLYVLWDTSERIGAVHQIHRDNIDLVKNWVSIEADCRKGGQQPRIYRVRPATIAKLKLLLNFYPGLQPFGECALNNLYKHLPRLRDAANLPKWATWHTLRKSHASHLAALCGDARASLGHSSNAITDRSYIDQTITAEALVQPCDLLFDPHPVILPMASNQATTKSKLRTLWSKLTGAGPKPALDGV